MLKATFIILTILVSHFVQAEQNIAGKWQHTTKPATILFNMNSQEALILQHDNADSEGLNLIRNIVKSEEKNLWVGEMFNGYQNTYVVVNIRLSDASTLVISTDTGEDVLKLVR